MVAKTIWNIAVTLLSMVGTLLLNMTVARCLTINEFGTFALLQSAVSTTSMFAGLWLGPLATKNVAEALEFCVDKLPGILKLFFLYVLSLSLAVILLVWINPAFYSSQIVGRPDMIIEVRVASLIVLLSTTEFLVLGVLAGFEKYGLTASVIALKTVIVLPASYILTKGYGVGGALIANFLCTLLSTCVGFWSVLRNLQRCKFGPDTNLTKSYMLNIGSQMLPNFLACVVSSPVNFILFKQLSTQPAGIEQVGAISAALMWKNSILLVPRRISATLLPYLSRNKINKWQMIESSRSIAILATFPCAITAACFSREIMSLLGEKFGSYPGFVGGVGLLAVISSIGTGVSALIMAENRHWFGLFTNVVSSVVALVLGGIIIPKAKGVGILVALNASAVVNLILTYAMIGANSKSESIVELLKAIILVAFGVFLGYITGGDSFFIVVLLNVLMVILVFKTCVSKVIRGEIINFVIKRGKT
jgi:O-antigen/teichoic acid export membrane protein